MVTRTNFRNAFETTLTTSFGPTDLQAFMDTSGGPETPCLLVIDPEDPTKREYILFDGDKDGEYYSTTTLTNRYLTDSAEPSGITHDAGAVVRMAPLAQHFENLHARIDSRVASEAHTKAMHDLLGISHASLSDLDTGDPHTQYLNETRHDTTARHGASVVDHGSIGGLDDDDHPQYLLTDGTRELAGDQSMGGNKLTNLDDPTDTSDGANKGYVDDLVGVSLSQVAAVVYHGDDETVSRPDVYGTVIWVGDAIPDEIADGDFLEQPGPAGTTVQAYTRVDGSRPFSAPVGGVDPVEPEDLATKRYVDNSGMFPGAIIATAAPLPDGSPDGWLRCDGSAISREDYADLFAVIGTTWGIGDGETTFNIPDARDRVLLGAGGGFTIGEEVGSLVHTHTIPEADAAGGHTHSQGNTGFGGSHSHANPNTSNTGAHTHSNPSTGNSGAHTHNTNNNSGGHSHNTGSAHASHSHTLGGPTSTVTAGITGSNVNAASSNHGHVVSQSDNTTHNHGSTSNTGAHAHNLTNTGTHFHNVGSTGSAGGHSHTVGRTDVADTHHHSNPDTDEAGEHTHQIGDASEESNLQPSMAVNVLIKT